MGLIVICAQEVVDIVIAKKQKRKTLHQIHPHSKRPN